MCGDEDDGGRKCRDQGVGRKRIQENSLLVVNQAHTYSSRRRKTNTKREDGFSQIGVLASDAMVHTQIGICRGCSSCLSALDKGATTRITSATANDRLDTPLPSINGNNVPPGERRFQPRPQLLLPPSFLCETESWLTNVPKILDTHTHIYIYIYIHSCRRNRLHKFYHAPRAPRRNVELLFVSLELRSSFLRFCSSWRPSIRKFSPAMAYWF